MNAFWKGIRNSFFAGLLVVVPIAASIAILLGLFNWLTDFLLLTRWKEHDLVYLFRISALVVFALLVTFVGWLTRLMVGKQVVALGETIITRVPLLGKIYGFVKEISSTMLGDKKTVFQRVVLVQYPRPGIYAIGLVTSQTEGEAQVKTQSQMINVFLPTTPNPTSGFLLLVPEEQLIEMEMSVGEGMKMIMSGGAVVPPYTGKTQQPALPATGQAVHGR